MIKFKDRFKKLKEANLPNSKEMAKKYGHKEIIKLFYNENKFGASPKVKERIKIKSPNIYPDYKSPELIKKLSSLYNLPKENFYVSNGSDAILDSIPTLFASKSKGNNVVIPELTFGRIEDTCRVEGVDIKKVDLINGKIDLGKIFEAIDDKTSIVYIVNPNMPTGTLNSHQEIMSFLKKVPSDVLVVIDEAYAEYAFGIEKSFEQVKEVVDKYDNIIVTRTWSKLFGLAAFRIGYMITSPYIVDLFRKSYQYLPVNKYSLQAAEAALSDLPFYNEVVEKTKAEKVKYYKLMDELNIKYLKSYGNFVYVMVNNNKEFELHLLKKYGVAVRSVRNNALRITIGTPKENLLVFKGLREIYG